MLARLCKVSAGEASADRTRSMTTGCAAADIPDKLLPSSVMHTASVGHFGRYVAGTCQLTHINLLTSRLCSLLQLDTVIRSGCLSPFRGDNLTHQQSTGAATRCSRHQLGNSDDM